MSDHDPKKTLSEISHLFLSSIRDKQTNGSPRPQRTPPQTAAPAPDSAAGSAPAPVPAPAPPQRGEGQGLPRREPGGPWSGMNIDLTPAELAQVGPDVQSPQGDAAAAAPRKGAPVTAVIAAHLNGRQFDRVKDYARHLAGQVGGRIGLIELDASEFRLMCFEPGMPAEDRGDARGQSAEVYDPRQISEAVEELNWDVQRWLLLL